MISRIRGTLLSIADDRVEVATPGGVVYEVQIPLSVARRLDTPGEEIELRTLHVVREDLAQLFGFLEPVERELFARLLGASGVGGKLALAMLSTFSARRLVQVLRSRDIPALVQVSGIGRKKAEKVLVELADKLDDLVTLRVVDDEGDPDAEFGQAQAAVQALVALGMAFNEADSRVREVLRADDAPEGIDEIVRRALARS